LAQQRAREKATTAQAIFASTTIPNRSSNCAACLPSGGNGKLNTTLDHQRLGGAILVAP
jgi:hypothetical protein